MSCQFMAPVVTQPYLQVSWASAPLCSNRFLPHHKAAGARCVSSAANAPALNRSGAHSHLHPRWYIPYELRAAEVPFRHSVPGEDSRAQPGRRDGSRGLQSAGQAPQAPRWCGPGRA